MSRNSPFHGGVTESLARTGRVFATVVRRALQADEDMTFTGFCALVGWPEETGRGYRDGDTSPAFDRLFKTLRRSTTPSAFVLDALQTLGGSRVRVELLDPDDVPAATRPSDVVKEAIQTLSGFDLLLQETYERAGDGEISADDAAAIAARWAEVKKLGDRVVRLSQYCAHGRTR